MDGTGKRVRFAATAAAVHACTRRFMHASRTDARVRLGNVCAITRKNADVQWRAYIVVYSRLDFGARGCDDVGGDGGGD